LPRSVGKGFVVEAASDEFAVDKCGRVSFVLWGFDPPSILIVTTPLKVFHHVLAHVAQVTRVLRIEFVDFAKVNGRA
jgi:hypothetical protein